MLREAQPPKTLACRLRAQAGFTMIEALVAALVFAFGAIGVAGMQTMSMQSTYEAGQRMQATYLANDIMERLRNNAEALDEYDNDVDTDWTIVGSGSIETAPTPNCASAACTPAELVDYDLWSWEQAIDGAAIQQVDIGNVGGLVNPSGCIRVTGSGQVEIAIAWRGRRGMSNATVATGCTQNGLYGDNDEYRRVFLVRTYVAPR